MIEKSVRGGLHLPDLLVENFRGIEKLSMPSLGRVTLLTGLNGVGKTTVLEAIEIFAARARYACLQDILRRREEYVVIIDEEGDGFRESEWGALFFGRDTAQKDKVLIGSPQSEAILGLEAISISDIRRKDLARLTRRIPKLLLEEDMSTLRVTFQGSTGLLPVFFSRRQGSSITTGDSLRRVREFHFLFRGEDSELPPPITCEEIGPGLIDNSDMSGYWDEVALEDDESQAIQALNLIYRNDVERVTMIGGDAQMQRVSGRRFMVKLKSQEHRVPLKSLGDGALRLFGVALALANSRDGFLLIDEAENGIHHSVQRNYWRMVLQTAYKNNVQVFATTHSYDCVRGFAQAAVENENVEGVLVRLEEEHDGLHAVRYSEEELRTAAEQKTEVR